MAVFLLGINRTRKGKLKDTTQTHINKELCEIWGTTQVATKDTTGETTQSLDFTVIKRIYGTAKGTTKGTQKKKIYFLFII